MEKADTTLGHGTVDEGSIFDLLEQIETHPRLTDFTQRVVEIETLIREQVTDDVWKLYMELETIESQYRIELVTRALAFVENPTVDRKQHA